MREREREKRKQRAFDFASPLCFGKQEREGVEMLSGGIEGGRRAPLILHSTYVVERVNEWHQQPLWHFRAGETRRVAASTYSTYSTYMYLLTSLLRRDFAVRMNNVPCFKRRRRGAFFGYEAASFPPSLLWNTFLASKREGKKEHFFAPLLEVEIRRLLLLLLLLHSLTHSLTHSYSCSQDSGR